MPNQSMQSQYPYPIFTKLWLLLSFLLQLFACCFPSINTVPVIALAMIHMYGLFLLINHERNGLYAQITSILIFFLYILITKKSGFYFYVLIIEFVLLLITSICTLILWRKN